MVQLVRVPRRARKNLERTHLLVLRFANLGSMNVEGLNRARREMLKTINTVSCPRIDIELNCNYVGASFVGVMVEVERVAKRCGKKISFHHIGPHAARMLYMCGYQHLLGRNASASVAIETKRRSACGESRAQLLWQRVQRIAHKATCLLSWLWIADNGT